MKLKPNVNVESVKRLLVQHGEKIAFGLAACVLLLFFYKTLRLEVLDANKQPGPLSELAERTKQHVVTSVWDRKAQNIEIEDYPARAEHVPLNEKDYHQTVYLDKPLWEQHDKRPIPKVLPVEELVASSGQAILAVKSEGEEAGKADAGTEKRPIRGKEDSKPRGAKLPKDFAPKGFYYVAVTGLVPLRQQSAAYGDAFLSALKYDSARDVPSYAYIKVERAEVTGANVKGVAWKEIDLDAVGKFIDSWPKEKIADVVDDEYIGEAYPCTMPLGPMLGEDWDPVIVGHPKIPLAARFDRTKKPEKETTASTTDRGAGWGPSAKPGAKAGGAASKAKAQTQAAKAAPTGPQHDHKLFRFVDYTVEPGKRYRYRVKLLLHNPNLDLADQYLKEPALAHTPTLETVWSESTPVVAVPRGFNVFVGPAVIKPSVSARDPEAEVCVVSFDRERGGEPAAKKVVQRGALLNFSVKDLWVRLADHTGLTKWDKVDFRSNALIVDIQGGRKLSNREKSLVEPVEVLVLDAEGNASVHEELDDADAFHAHLDSLELGAKPKDEPVVPKNPYEKPDKSRGGSQPAKAPSAKPARSAAN